MAPRISLLRRSLLRPLLLSQTLIPRIPQALSTLQTSVPISNPNSSFPPPKPSPFAFPGTSFPPSRAFSSATGSSGIVIIGSEEGFNTALNKIQDEKLPALFYFTAAWCGPCKFLSPVIEEMSKAFPHVTTYKIDIDQEGLQKILSELKIYSVPTVHFFQEGKKAAEMVGADTAKLKSHMDTLYKKE